MEGCLGASNSGSVSPETVRRWIANVDNVLCKPEGRKKFQDFLENCDGFEGGVQLIMFWEMCHNVVPDEEIISKKKKKRRLFSSPKDVEDETLYTKANEILSFANDNINLDVGYLERIHRATENRSSKEVMRTIFEAKTEAVHLLDTYHALFKENLLQQQGVAQST